MSLIIMDREAIETSVRYEQLREQHFNGSYFSEAVRSQAEDIKELSHEENLALFADTFNIVYAAAEVVQAHPLFNTDKKEIDLGNEGLGTITIDLSLFSEDDVARLGDEGDTPNRGVIVQVDAFNPTPERHEEWINAPGDELGLETAGPTMVQSEQESNGWVEHIYADLDGSYRDDDLLDINHEIMRLLDAKETLDIICEKLNLEVPSPAAS